MVIGSPRVLCRLHVKERGNRVLHATAHRLKLRRNAYEPMRCGQSGTICPKRISKIDLCWFSQTTATRAPCMDPSYSCGTQSGGGANEAGTDMAETHEAMKKTDKPRWN